MTTCGVDADAYKLLITDLCNVKDKVCKAIACLSILIQLGDFAGAEDARAAIHAALDALGGTVIDGTTVETNADPDVLEQTTTFNFDYSTICGGTGTSAPLDALITVKITDCDTGGDAVGFMNTFMGEVAAIKFNALNIC